MPSLRILLTLSVAVSLVMACGRQESGSDLSSDLEDDFSADNPRCLASKASGAHYGWILAIAYLKEEGHLTSQRQCKRLAGKESNEFLSYLRSIVVTGGSKKLSVGLKHHDYVTSCACEEVFSQEEDKPFTRRLSDIWDRVKTIDSDIKKKKKKIRVLKGWIGDTDDNLKEAKTDLRKLKSDIDDLRKKAKDVEKERHKARKKLRGLMREKDRIRLPRCNKYDRICKRVRRDLERKLNRVKSDISHIQIMIDGFEKELSKLSNAARKVQDKINQVSSRVGKLRATLKERKDSISAGQGLLKKWQDELEGIVDRLSPIPNGDVTSVFGRDCGTGVTAALIPEGWGLPGSDVYADFRPACREHDRCYNEQRGRAQCDTTFHQDLRKACKQGFSDWTGFLLQRCYDVASIYYKAVDKAGGDAYDEAG